MGVACLGHSPGYVQAQGYSTLDPTTQKSLNEVRQLLLMGETEEVEKLIRQIINGSGYIEPLAEVYYQLAQNENEIETLISHYSTILEEWKDSPWSAKAIVELIPLVLMSGGRLSDRLENMIWLNQNQWMASASKAASIGDDPKLLREELILSLIELAHAHGRVDQIPSLVDKVDLIRNVDKAELALAYSKIKNQQKKEAVQDLNRWLENYTQSLLRPFAWLALFHAAQDQEVKHQAVNALLSQHENTLEGKMIQRYVSVE